MARTAAAKIRIVADADGVKRATRDAEQALDRLNKSATSRFKGMSAAAKASAVGGVAVAGAALVKFGSSAVDAAKESEVAMARVRKNIEAVGLDYEKYSDQIDAAAAAAAKKGFDDEAAAESASRLAQKNKDVAEGIRLSAVAMDVARARSMSLESATNLVVKAQMGQSGALRRLGIDIDKSASSQEMLATLQQRYAGQADAYAKSNTADRLKVSWENFQETIGQKILPIIAKLQVKLADFIDWLNEDWPRIWARVKNEAKPVLEWLWPFVKRIFDNVKNAIQLVVNILQGDWGEAWGNVKTIVSNQIKNLGQLAGTAARAGLAIGKAIGRGIANGLIALVELGINTMIKGLNQPARLLNKVLPDAVEIPEIGRVSIPRVGGGSSGIKDSGALREDNAGFASGGVVPGPAGAGDVVPARLTPGEVVLNKRQQALVGAGRIMQVLAATGGKIGQGRFATGGVATALKFAQAQLGEPYVWGGGHEGVVERRGWDCSGFASNVAARVPGYTGGIGTTMSLYPRSKRAAGNEPVVFGFLGMDQSNPAKQHMGIRINGQWFEAAGGGRGVIRGRSNWPSGLRIPPGLEYLSTQKASSSPNEADGGQSPVTRQAAAQKAAVTKAVAAALKGTSYSERDGMSSSPSGAVAAGISERVTAAGRAALAAGQTPEQIREAMDDRQRDLEIAWVKREINTALAEMGKVSGAITKVRARLKTARKALGKARAVKGRARGPAVQKAYGVVLALVKKEQELLEAQSGVREWLTDLRARALDLDIAAQEDALEGTDTSSTSSSVDAGVDADTSAQLTQAQTAAATAQAGQLASDQFIRAALGPGDLAQGGLTAWQAAGGTLNVNVQTLHPGDPNTLQAIVEAVARAANQSPSTMATGQVVTV